MEREIMPDAGGIDTNCCETFAVWFEEAHDCPTGIFGTPKPQIDDSISPWPPLAHVHHGLGTTTSNIDSGHQTAAAVRHGITERTFLRALEPAQSEQCVAGLVWKFSAHPRHP